MATTYILRKGTAQISFTHNDDKTVTIDEGDNMPTTDSAESARAVWQQFVDQGYTRQVSTATVAPTVPASVATPTPRITVPISRSGNGTQRERDVNRAMDSTRRGLAGRTMNHGVEAMISGESKARDMQRVLAKLKEEGGLYILNYYIPVELSVSHGTRGSDNYIPIRIPSPVADFRGLAIHLDGSNWLMTKDALESETVQDFLSTMRDHKDFVGGEYQSPAYWDTHIREEEYQKFVAIAELKFMNYIRSLHTSLIECIANADQALQTAQQSEEWKSMTDKQQSAAEAYRNNRIRSRIKKADEELADAIKCAERFDMTEELSDLFAALRAAIRSQRETFNVNATRIGVKRA